MEKRLLPALTGTRITGFRYFDTIDSTNDEALRWIANGAPDFSLVIANEQTKGRGRFDRRWVTKSGTALAFTLILTNILPDPRLIPFFSPLGGIAVQEAVQDLLGLDALIKWPNDVLIDGRKFCGILVEAAWQGARLQGVVMGIGINVSPGSIPDPAQQSFPAVCLETAFGQPVDRVELLKAVINAVDKWRGELGTAAFMQRWEEKLAFKGEWVRIEHSEKPSIIGKVKGIDGSGRLVLIQEDGTETRFEIGDVHLRPDAHNTAGGLHAG